MPSKAAQTIAQNRKQHKPLPSSASTNNQEWTLEKMPLLPLYYKVTSGVEYRVAFGTDEEIQCASLVGVFVRARSMISVK